MKSKESICANIRAIDRMKLIAKGHIQHAQGNITAIKSMLTQAKNGGIIIKKKMLQDLAYYREVVQSQREFLKALEKRHRAHSNYLNEHYNEHNKRNGRI